jgi:signal transduction histidine kinase
MSLGYHSIYWRIGIGFIVCIAAVLVIQGSVLLFLVNRAIPDARTSFTSELSRQLATAIQQNPRLDIETFVKVRYPKFPLPFYIVMTSGSVFYFGDRQPPRSAINGVLREFERQDLQTIPASWIQSPYWASSIFVNGRVRGIVSVVPRDFVDQLWRPMAVLAVGLLVTGTMLSSWFIWGPAHRRLKSLEATAQRLGGGDINAQAEEEGADEVAALARAFNVMARDLSARSAQVIEFDRTRRLLLADISHELMTPLTAIRVCHEKLSTDPAIRGALQRRQYVAIIGEETLRVERIVRDLLDLAKFENNSDALDLLDVSIEGLFGRVTARQQADAAKHGVTLTASIETGAEIVRGDPFRLEQALQNLAANALRHVPTGGSVDLYAKIAGGEIIITVRDTGAGVEAEHLPFIFNRFYKVDSSRVAGPEGSGLGLSIVKAIVERHGGTVAVASQPHVETVFTIRLPASTDVAAIKQTA